MKLFLNLNLIFLLLIDLTHGFIIKKLILKKLLGLNYGNGWNNNGLNQNYRNARPMNYPYRSYNNGWNHWNGYSNLGSGFNLGNYGFENEFNSMFNSNSKG